MPRQTRRTVHLGQQIWRYVIGKWGVKIFPPEGNSAYHGYDKVLPGVDISRGRRKRWLHITPSDIKSYIERELI